MTIRELCGQWAQNSKELHCMAQAERALYDLCVVVQAELKAGREVSLPVLGKLKVKERQARKGRNPQTGETIDIPAKRKVVLAMSKALDDRMN